MKTPAFTRIFGNRPTTVIGMIHVRALPGTPLHADPVHAIIQHALDEAQTYANLGIHALMIENMHDIPYLRSPGPAVTAAMSVIAAEIRRAHPALPLGIQILAGANRQALAAAHAAGAQFIRAEGFVFGHLADEGYIDACAGDLLRYRRQIGADHIAIFTDIKKKHSSHALTADLDIVQTAHAAEFFLSDGVILTGAATGQAASLAELQAVHQHTSLPVLIGSGITAGNIRDYLPHSDALIIGSSFKQNGHWANPLDPARIRQIMDALSATDPAPSSPD